MFTGFISISVNRALMDYFDKEFSSSESDAYKVRLKYIQALVSVVGGDPSTLSN